MKEKRALTRLPEHFRWELSHEKNNRRQLALSLGS